MNGANVVSASFGRIWAIALNTFREAVRNRVLAVLVIFAVGLMAFSLVLGELSLHEEVRVIKDIGLGGLSLVSVVIALFLGVNLLSKELERKTVYFIVPKPLYRWEFLIGKYVGLLVTLFSLVALMSLILAAFVAMQGGTTGIVMIRAEMLVALELALLTAIALLFSSFSSPYLSAMFTAALWMIGRNMVELTTFAEGKLAGTPIGALLEFISRVLPDFHLFFISGANIAEGQLATIHGTFVSWGYVADAAAYAAAYAALCLTLAVGLFSRRDFV